MLASSDERVRPTLSRAFSLGLALCLLIGAAPASAQFISDIEVIETTVFDPSPPPPPPGDGWVLHSQNFSRGSTIQDPNGAVLHFYTRVGTGATPLTDLYVGREVVPPGFPWELLSSGNVNATADIGGDKELFGAREPSCKAIVEIRFIREFDDLPAGWTRAQGSTITSGNFQPGANLVLIYRTEDLGVWQ